MVSISITPTNPNVQEEGTIPLTATGTRSDNSYINLTNTAEWSSSDYEIASVSENGVVTRIGEGIAVITASLMLL